MDKYAYCTNGAEYLIYKEFTAPPFQCEETKVVTHSTLDQILHTTVSWGMWDAGLLCRVII